MPRVYLSLRFRDIFPHINSNPSGKSFCILITRYFYPRKATNAENACPGKLPRAKKEGRMKSRIESSEHNSIIVQVNYDFPFTSHGPPAFSPASPRRNCPLLGATIELFGIRLSRLS